MKNRMRIALNKGFNWPGGNLTEMAREAGKLQGRGIVVSTFDIVQK